MADVKSAWQDYDYVAVAKSRPTTYLTQDEQPARFFASFVEPLQDLEEVFRILYESLSIYRATGIMLDSFGEMVNEPRLARDDDTYRTAILNKRFTSGGSGTPEELMTSIGGLTNASTKGVRILNHPPAAYIAITDGDTIPLSLPLQIHQNSVAGVAAYPVFDYGVGGFELSGVSGKALNALGIHPGSDVAVGYKPGDDIVVGVDSSIEALGGTPLASTREEGAADYGSASAGAFFYGSFDAYRQTS